MSNKLGKRPAVASPNDFRFEALVQPGVTLPTPPGRFGHASMYRGDAWLMLANGPDPTAPVGAAYGVGDCVIAGGEHETMETARLARHPVPPFTGATAVADYSKVTGYVVGDPNTDQGTDVRTALSYRRKTGLVDANRNRHKIGAYIALDPKDWGQLMQAVYIFSAVGIGFEFPDSAMQQFDNGEPWDVVTGASIEGGHYVPVMGRSSINVAGVVSWARRQSMTRAFYEQYCVAGEHRVLTADLRWVASGDLQVGDELLAFTEQQTKSGRFYRKAVVTSARAEMAETVDVELSDGRVIRVTPEHRWLAGRTSGGWNWIETRRMCRSSSASAKHGEKYATKLWPLIETWDDAQSYGDGWLAGILDGEGYLTQPQPYGCIVGMSQNEGLVLNRALDELARLGMLASTRVYGGGNGSGAVATERRVRMVQIWGKTMTDRLALLGRVRPSRLLAKLDIDRLGRLERRLDPVHVVDIRPAGRVEIAKVATSERTMIIEGFPMHNCDEAWAIVYPEELNASGLNERGLNLAQLNAALAQL